MTGAWRTISVALTANSAQYQAAMAKASASTAGFDATNKKAMASTQSRWATVGKGVAVGAALIGVALAAAIKEAISWESAWAGVTKTVAGTPEQMKSLEDSLLDLGRTLPATRTEIAGVAQAAGQLGIETENVADFTEVMIAMGVSTNMSAEEAAVGFARLANIMGTSQTDFDRMGSAVVDLGNNFATTESEILDMSLRLATAGRAVGLTEGDVLGLSTAISSLGIRSQAGGSAMSRVLINIGTEVDAASEGLQEFARIADVSASDFANAWKNDPAEAFSMLVTGLARVRDEGESLFQLLDDLGMGDLRVGNLMRGLVANTALLEQALVTGNQAWEENTALQEEAEKRYATTASKLVVLKNQITDVARIVGTEFLPAVQGAIEGIQSLGQMIGDVGSELAGELSGAWDDLVSGAKDLGAALAVVWDVAKPVVEVLAALAAGAVVGTIIGLSAAFAGLAGFLAENEWLVRALVVTLGVLITKAAAAAVLNVLSNGIAAIGTFAHLAVEGLKGLAVGIRNVAASSAASNVNALHGALAGISTGAVLGGAALVGLGLVMYAWQDDAKKAAKRAADVTAEAERMATAADAAGLSVEDWYEKVGAPEFWREHGDALSEYGFSVEALTGALDGSGQSADEFQSSIDAMMANSDNWTDKEWEAIAALEEQGKALEKNTEDAEAARQAKQDLGYTTEEEKAIHEANTEAVASSAEQYQELAEAVDEALESIREFYGDLNSLLDQEIATKGALNDVTEAIKEQVEANIEGARGWDINTEGGQKNYEMARKAQTEIVDYGIAMKENGATAEEAAAGSIMYAAALEEQMIQAGMTKEAAHELIEELGLTPAQIQTTWDVNVGAAEDEVKRMEGILEAYEGSTWSTYLDVDSQAASDALDSIEVRFNAYMSSNPEATAALDITDPVAREKELRGISQRWWDADPEATAYFETYGAKANASALDAFVQRTVRDVYRKAEVHATATGINAVNVALNSVARDRQARVNVTMGVIQNNTGMSTGQIFGRRWGGIDHMASGGIRQAQMGSGSNIVWWDEPETGGEAYIPRLGNKNRNRSILEIAAGWQGLTLTDPTKAHKMATGGVMHAIPHQATGGGSVVDQRSMTLEVSVTSTNPALAGKQVVEAINRNYPDFAKVVDRHERAHQ